MKDIRRLLDMDKGRGNGVVGRPQDLRGLADARPASRQASRPVPIA
ncbi:MAG: hypothetical protein LBR22_07080 [Desulfovibrio sp.]|nr:hypothetical protein [Desulfovibrio sp.]